MLVILADIFKVDLETAGGLDDSPAKTYLGFADARSGQCLAVGQAVNWHNLFQLG